MVQPKNAFSIYYTSNKDYRGEDFRYASDEAIKRAREILKSKGALFLITQIATGIFSTELLGDLTETAV